MRSASRRATSSATAGGRASPSTRWDGTLLRAWETTIDPAGTFHLRGDVALARALDPARLARLGAMPARKVLVLGNHDFGPTGTPTETGSDETSMTLVIPDERTLLVTHIPLWRVPAGRVNGHGEVHNHERLCPETSISICVEQTGYRPLPLEAVRELAAGGLEESRRRPSSGCWPRRRLPTQKLAGRTRRPGVAVGLCRTAAGVDVLLVEASRMPGSTGLVLIGRLGEVTLTLTRGTAGRPGLRPAPTQAGR